MLTGEIDRSTILVLDGNILQKGLHKYRRYPNKSEREENLPGGFVCEPGVNCVREGRKERISTNSQCKGLDAETAWHVNGAARSSMWL